jgi:hypothetical protein
MGCKKTVSIKIRLTRMLYITLFATIIPLISFFKKQIALDYW